jgi:hypothetical protein
VSRADGRDYTPAMIRRLLVASAIFALLALSAVACKKEEAGGGPDGGPAPKPLYCKVTNQCWICADEAALTKCILNPVTSGCKQGTFSDCP